MLDPRVAIRVVALTLVAALAAAAPARAVTVNTGTGSGIAGQTVDITLTSSSTTGLGIQSLQFDLSYNATLVTATDVIEAGTLVGAAGWGDATFGVTTAGSTGKIRVSHAGATPLSGAGALIVVRFVINPAQLTATSSALTLANLIFNEGAPNDTTTNGSITINATPIITVSPNTGEIVRGQTLSFSVSGSVSNPVAWSTTDPLIATISSAGVLTGVAPGAVRVHALDNAGHSDQSDGDILVRGMGLTAGSGSVVQGQSLSLPLTVTSLDGLGIRSGQVKLTYNANLLTATGVSAPAGTLLSTYAAPGFGQSSGTCTVDFAGTTDLGGSGVLCYVSFQSNAALSGSTGITVAQALFNEIYPAKTTNGSVTVNPIPSISVQPDVVSLLAGQTQQFTLGGSPTPPVTWSVLDPTIASIGTTTGLLTALKGGVTQVRAQDNVGAIDLNTSLTVYDFRIAPDTVTALPGATVALRLRTDRLIGGLGIQSLQYRLQWSSPYILSAQAKTQGLIAPWAPNIIAVSGSNNLTVTAAGSTALGSGSREVQWITFQLDPAAPAAVDIPITLASLLCNEGTPSAQIGNGLIRVRNTTDVAGGAPAAALALAPPEPNPAVRGARLRFTLPDGGAGGDRVRLAVLGLDGRVVRVLVDGTLPAGEHDVEWQGRDQRGAPVAPGVYFVRLESRGRVLARKLAVVR